MVNAYKYEQSNGSTKKSDIVFLRVIKIPYWIGSSSHICEYLPVGALTWTDKEYLKKDENGLYTIDPDCSLVIENNQFCINFDPSCFEVLHTSTQKIKK